MFDQNAGFILVAFGVSAVFTLGLGLQTLWAARSVKARLQRAKEKAKGKD